MVMPSARLTSMPPRHHDHARQPGHRPAAELRRSVAILAELVEDGLLAGIHLEGPWLSERRCGAHEARQLRDPDPDELRTLFKIGRGTIKMITLAPNWPVPWTRSRSLLIMVRSPHSDTPMPATTRRGLRSRQGAGRDPPVQCDAADPPP